MVYNKQIDNLNRKQMNRNYYTASQPFYLTENKVRQIVQAQLQIFFTDIKQQIEMKIKQIDHNIIQMRTNIRKIQQKNEFNPDELLQKLNQLHQRIEEVKKYKQSQIQKLTEQMRNRSIDRSYDRKLDKSPLFRKNNTAPSFDLNNILFGDQNTKTIMNTMPMTQKNNQIQTKPNIISKPPLPKMKSQPQMSENKHDRNMQLKVNINNNEQNNSAFGQQYQQQHKSEGAISYDEQKQQTLPSTRLVQSLNKNKNSFMRQKSLKKIGTIQQQQIQQSLLSSQGN